MSQSLIARATIRAGAESAVLRARVQAGRDDPRLITLELEVTTGRSNVARLNRAPLQRPRRCRRCS